MRLVDDRRIKGRCEFADGSAAAIDPGLDHRDLAGREFTHGLARILLGLHQIGGVAHVVGLDLVDRRQSAACRQKSRGRRVFAGRDLVAQLVGQFTEIGTHREARGDAEIGKLVHMVENVFARVILRTAGEVAHVADVGMRIDQGRDHGLAGEVDTPRACRNIDFATPADRGEPVTLDHEGGIFDRRAAVSRDETRGSIQQERIPKS